MQTDFEVNYERGCSPFRGKDVTIQNSLLASSAAKPWAPKTCIWIKFCAQAFPPRGSRDAPEARERRPRRGREARVAPEASGFRVRDATPTTCREPVDERLFCSRVPRKGAPSCGAGCRRRGGTELRRRRARHWRVLKLPPPGAPERRPTRAQEVRNQPRYVIAKM